MIRTNGTVPRKSYETHLFLLKTDAKSTIIGIISSRPISITAERSSFEKAEYPAKLPTGPTASSPGPILLIHEMTAVALVVNEKPSTEIRRMDETIIKT